MNNNIKKMDQNKGYFNMTNLSAYEINYFRPLLCQAFDNLAMIQEVNSK